MLGPEASWETADGEPVTLPVVPHDDDDTYRSRRELDFLACGNFTFIQQECREPMGAAGAARLEEALEDLVNSQTRLCIFLLVLTRYTAACRRSPRQKSCEEPRTRETQPRFGVSLAMGLSSTTASFHLNPFWMASLAFTAPDPSGAKAARCLWRRAEGILPVPCAPWWKVGQMCRGRR